MSNIWLHTWLSKNIKKRLCYWHLHFLANNRKTVSTSPVIRINRTAGSTIKPIYHLQYFWLICKWKEIKKFKTHYIKFIIKISLKHVFDVNCLVPNQTFWKKSQFLLILHLLGSFWPLESCAAGKTAAKRLKSCTFWGATAHWLTPMCEHLGQGTLLSELDTGVYFFVINLFYVVYCINIQKYLLSSFTKRPKQNVGIH